MAQTVNNRVQYINFALVLILIWSLFSFVRFTISGVNALLIVSSLVFATVLLGSTNIKRSLCRFDFFTIYVVFYMVIRYVIYPYFFCLSESSLFYNLPYSSEASLLFIVECFFTLIVFDRTLSKMPSYQGLDTSSLVFGRDRVGLIVFLLVLSVGVYAAVPSVSDNYKFIWDLSIVPPEERELTSLVDSIAYIIIDVTRLLCPLVIISTCYKKYSKTSKRKYLIYSFLACIIPLLLIKNMNRGSSFFTSIIYLWMVCNIYGWKKSRWLAISVLGFLFFLLTVVSLVKHATSIENNGTTRSNAYETVQGYTLGVESLRYGLEANDLYSTLNKGEIFFNDCFASLPILNRFADSHFRYTNLYNNVCYANAEYNKNDAIAPILTHMLYVFSLLGIIIPLLFLVFAVRSYKKALVSSSLNMAFIYIYMALVLETGRVGSFSATLATLIWSILPLYIIVRLSSK